MMKPRLFESKIDSYHERKSGERQFKRKIYIAFEGSVTEPKYIDEVKKKLESNSNSVVDIIPLNRDEDDGKSHPNHVRDGMVEFYKYYKHIIDENDSLWIIIDIDRHFGSSPVSKSKKYQEFLNTLKTSVNKEIFAAVSMPSFEFWLILHYVSVDNLDLKEIKTNKKSGKKTYVKKLLSDLRTTEVASYNDTLEIALERANDKRLESDIGKLSNNVGTTVHKLIEDILDLKNI